MASSSRGIQQDSFIDDDDLTCPLCVEEFDLSDRNFRPCPCGYQVCQFCFNNIKNNMNGLCPACRRPYDEKTMEFKIVTPEEIAQFKANAQKNAKKKAAERQKEAQKREVESLNRKHLAGLRVVQKNLVYVVGLSPGIPESDLLKTLRGDKYFGQYGNIIKIVVSKAKAGDAAANGSSLGVYVTFARKEDAARCIAAVNGSQNGDRVLRAQLGTTKYCSAYLRNEACTNKQCMFLHEPGDNDESYSRQDLSSINSVATQRPLPVTTPSATSVNRQAAQAQAPVSQSQPVAAASQPMAREPSKEDSESGDGSALPSSASWANRGAHAMSRRGSLATSGAASSPAISNAMPATAEAEEPEEEQAEQNIEDSPSPTAATFSPSSNPPLTTLLMTLVKSINALATCSETHIHPDDDLIRNFPPLFDDEGGKKRRAIREQLEEARLGVEQEPSDLDPLAESHEDEHQPESGSLQLGGEPEDLEDSRNTSSQQGFQDQRRPSAQLPIQRSSEGQFGGLGQGFPQNIGNISSVNGRSLTPAQQQQLLLFKSGQPQSGFLDQFPQGLAGAPQSSLFQQQGHNRQSSRYTFGNDSSSLKLAVNLKPTAQQSSMMSQQGNQFYGSSMPGPPPGLKSSGTPPINGSGMFGQGHGFGGSAFGGANRDSNNDIYREIMRNRGSGQGGVQGHDAGKHDQGILSLDEVSMSVDALVADSAADDLGSPAPSLFGMVSRSSTPTVPPGFSLPHGHPSPAPREDPIAKPLSRIVPTSAPFTPTRNISSHVPRAATPLANVSVPATPVQRVATPLVPMASASKSKQDVKSLATDTGLSKMIASQATHSAVQGLLQSEDFPILQKGKGKDPIPPVIPKSMLPAAKTPSGRVGPESIKSSDANDKHPVQDTPAVGATTQASAKDVPSIDTSVKAPSTSSSAFPPLPPSTPSATTPVVRAALKTLRVVPTPKSETPSVSASTPMSSASFAAPPLLQSRQPSLASVVRLDRPGTPASEIISDNASITSTSMSRPSSPPPSKVGSAPMRTTTKSQQKKQRKEAQKEKEKSELDTVVDRPEPEVEIAPILGRKKKMKNKDKATGKSTPTAGRTVSRQPSPGPASTTDSTKPSKSSHVVEQKSAAPSRASPKSIEEPIAKSELKSRSKAKVEAPVVLEPPAPSVETVQEPPEKLTPSAASVLQDLVAAGILPDPNKLVLFKAPVSSNQRLEFSGDLQDLEHKLIITEEDRAALQAGRPVRKVAQGVSRILLTPNGDCVRNLSPAEEDRYLELQSRILQESGPTAFVSARHNATNGFTLIGGRAVPNGPPAFFPQVEIGTATAPMDAVSKIQRDEALSYINQYVLPSLSTNSQLERALNANALDAEMLRPNESQTWGGWGVGVGVNSQMDLIAAQAETNTALTTPYGSNNNDGILATGLESMTAHFAVGRENGRGQPLGNVSLLTLADSESALQTAKKETEKLEKSLNQLLKKNRRLMLGGSH